MKQIKTLVLTPDYFPQLYGGIGTYVGQLYKYFDNKYLTICFIPYERTAPFPKMENLISFDVHSKIQEFQENSYVYWEKFNEYAYAELVSNLEKFNIIPDVLHVHGSYFALLAQALKEKYSCKIIYVKHGVEHNYWDPDHLKDSIMLSIADQIICPSQWIADEVVKMHPLFHPTSRVIHSGIELEEDFIEDIKENRILFCGRLSKRKGADILIRAIAQIAPVLRKQKYKMDVIGVGEQMENIQFLVQVNKIEDIVTLRGYLDNSQVHHEMAKARILVVPSLNEPFGLVAVEGFSHEMCVIASRSAGLQEIIADQNTGILFEPGNETDLARKLAYIVTNPQIGAQIGYQARQTLPYFSWKRVYEEYQKVNKGLCDSVGVNEREQ